MADSAAERRESPGGRGKAGASFAAQLSFEGVTMLYGRNAAVRELSLTVEPAQILCLLGPSGCGKSTLLRLAAGLERPTSGRVLLDGREVSGPERFVPAEKRGVGLMFQDFALFPHLSVLRNVMFGLSGVSRHEAERTAVTALRRVGLERHRDLYPHLLSGGEQQRVALARAIAPRPRMLLMDEPFSGLDARLRDDVRDETISVLRETRATCVVVTHDPEEAMRMGDRIALMRGGRLAQLGTPEELYRRPKDLATARFFSPINEIRGEIRAGCVVTPLARFAAPPGLSEGPVTVAVRPHHLAVRPLGRGAHARIVRRRFLGEVEHVEVSAQGVDEILHLRLDAAAVPEAGSEFAIGFEPRDALIFANETS